MTQIQCKLELCSHDRVRCQEITRNKGNIIFLASALKPTSIGLVKYSIMKLCKYKLLALITFSYRKVGESKEKQLVHSINGCCKSRACKLYEKKVDLTHYKKNSTFFYRACTLGACLFALLYCPSLSNSFGQPLLPFILLVIVLVLSCLFFCKLSIYVGAISSFVFELNLAWAVHE